MHNSTVTSRSLNRDVTHLVATHAEAECVETEVELGTATDPDAADGVGRVEPREGVELEEVILKYVTPPQKRSHNCFEFSYLAVCIREAIHEVPLLFLFVHLHPVVHARHLDAIFAHLSLEHLLEPAAVQHSSRATVAPEPELADRVSPGRCVRAAPA